MTRRPARNRGPSALPTISFDLITTDEALADVAAELTRQPAYALDTEFHREKTYSPRVALVQIAWPGDHIVLIDPLAVDISPLAAPLDGEGIAVLHASDQDLEVLDLTCH